VSRPKQARVGVIGMMNVLNLSRHLRVRDNMTTAPRPSA